MAKPLMTKKVLSDMPKDVQHKATEMLNELRAELPHYPDHELLMWLLCRTLRSEQEANLARMGWL